MSKEIQIMSKSDDKKDLNPEACWILTYSGLKFHPFEPRTHGD